MNSDPTDAEWLRASAAQIKSPTAQGMAYAKIRQYEAQEAMNRASMQMLFTEISAYIQTQQQVEAQATFTKVAQREQSFADQFNSIHSHEQ